MIDRQAIRRRWDADGSKRDGRGRRLFADSEVGPAGHFLGTAHTLEHFEKAFFMPTIMDFNPFEQWSAEGAKDHDTRGRDKAKAALAAYQKPPMEASISGALDDFVARRESELPDAVS